MSKKYYNYGKYDICQFVKSYHTEVLNITCIDNISEVDNIGYTETHSASKDNQ